MLAVLLLAASVAAAAHKPTSAPPAAAKRAANVQIIDHVEAETGKPLDDAKQPPWTSDAGLDSGVFTR